MLDSAENNQTKLDLNVSTDGGAFLRQTCPSCGLDFKTEVDQAGLAHLLEEEAAFVGEELGQSTNPLAGELERVVICCPYCGFEGDPEDLITEERYDYFAGVINKQFIRPVFDNLFSELGSRGSKDGLLSISISHTRSAPPPLPLEGPEPNDMTAISLLCCRKRVKVLNKWRYIDQCPYCTTSVRVE